MKQILLVLRKDCRKFWPEILLSLAITSAFVWLNPYMWRTPVSASSAGLGLDWQRLVILAKVVEVLLPVTWLILIARVVQDENLVGNRQFWVTRPYIWQFLLGEKLLFVAIFVAVPFTIAQVCLLVRAGISPSGYLPNLGFSLVLVGSWVLVVFALAAVTSSLLRLIGTILAFVVLLIGIAFFSNAQLPGLSVSVPYSDHISILLFVAFSGAVLIAQYSSRKVWLSRTLLAVLAGVVTILATSPFAISLLERDYRLPAPGERTSISLSVSRQPYERVDASWWRNGAYVSIPFEVSGPGPDELLLPDDMRLTIDAADGTRLQSPWVSRFAQHLASDPGGSLAGSSNIDVDRAVYDRIEHAPVAIHLAIAFTELTADSSQSVPFEPSHAINLPGIGACSYTSEDNDFYFHHSLSCSAAFHQPEVSRITVVVSPSPCIAGTPTQPGSVQETTWVDGPFQPDLADLNLSPVRAATIDLAGHQHQPEERYALCPGSPITITKYRLVRRFQYELDIPNFQLPIDNAPHIE